MTANGASRGEREVPVLIAGGGLVGLSTAMFLAQQGVASIALERLRGGSPVPRAAHFHMRTLELFRQAGIEDEVKRTSEEEFLPEGAIIAMREAALLAASASARANEGQLAMAEADLGRAEEALRERAGRAKNAEEKKRLLGSAQQIDRARKSVSTASRAPAAAKKAKGRAAALELNDAAMAFDGY